MHILHVTPYFPPSWSYGGIPRIVDGLTKALVSLETQITVLTTDAFDQNQRAQTEKTRKYHGMLVKTVPNASNYLAYNHQLFLPIKTPQALGEIPKPDIIHMHGHRHLLNNMVLKYAKENKIPYVLTANGTLTRHEKKKRIKWVWDMLIAGKIPQEASRCIAVSPADVTRHRNYGIPAKKIVQIANGLDLEEFSPLPKRGYYRDKLGIGERKLAVYLGQISPRKGVTHLVQAFCGPILTDSHVIIAGNDMGAKSAAQQLAKGAKNIHFVGLLKGKERLKLLADADVLVYASTNEIFGLSPFEGLLCGAPAVVGDDCGCGQLISNAQAGLLVQHGDVDDLRSKLQLIFNDPIAAKAMVNRGRSYIQKNLLFSTIAKRHKSLYQEVIDEHSLS